MSSYAFYIVAIFAPKICQSNIQDIWCRGSWSILLHCPFGWWGPTHEVIRYWDHSHTLVKKDFGGLMPISVKWKNLDFGKWLDGSSISFYFVHHGFLKLYLTVCDQNWNQNILISSSVIFATLSCQGIKYEPVLKKTLTTLPCFMTFQPSEVKKMSTREKVMKEEEDMPPRMFQGKPPKCHNCGVIGHTEK